MMSEKEAWERVKKMIQSGEVGYVCNAIYRCCSIGLSVPLMTQMQEKVDRALSAMGRSVTFMPSDGGWEYTKLVRERFVARMIAELE